MATEKLIREAAPTAKAEPPLRCPYDETELTYGKRVKCAEGHEWGTDGWGAMLPARKSNFGTVLLIVVLFALGWIYFRLGF